MYERKVSTPDLRQLQAMTSCESSSKMVNKVLFHCRYDASMPAGIGEPSARLPKRKWYISNYRGEACEMEDIDEKAVFVFENANVSKKITAVIARYSRHSGGFVPEACVTCNFIFNASETSDTGDFSEMHIKITGACSYGV